MHTSFNTSHITLYQTSGTGTDRRKQVSIHLMLLFIDGTLIGHHTITLFQYISCYSLSVKAVQTFPVYTRFNTSHVTLYRFCRSDSNHRNPVSIHLMLLFISISPALLSQHFDVSIHLMLLFIIFAQINCNFLYSFNTSHVTLYQHLEQPSSSARSCFNTSHVTLYLPSLVGTLSVINVSIHLMLLFIGEHFNGQDVTITFQYISCYSLSEILHSDIDGTWLFQYISCYSLSESGFLQEAEHLCFNTSHVTLYHLRNLYIFLITIVSIHLMLLFIMAGAFVGGS